MSKVSQEEQELFNQVNTLALQAISKLGGILTLCNQFVDGDFGEEQFKIRYRNLVAGIDWNEVMNEVSE